MHDEHGFNWLSFLGVDLHHYPSHVVMAVVVSLLLIVTTFIARGQLTRVMNSSTGGLIPEEKLTYRNFFEIVAESLYKLTESVIGHHDAPIYYPVIGTLFIFIFTANVFGLIPGFLPPTDNLNTTLALGAFVFVYYNYVGLRAHGLAYLKHFLGPIIWLAPLMLIIEVASHVFRPLSLALRLRGNIMGDHVVLGVFSGLVPYLLPVIFYGLGVFVAFIQAFVFCLMTMVYISLSTAHDH
ncbi:MAG: ATP synthase F0 subunit A [Bdellovibrionales bacterium GWB1_55_8]|nr:MAG: ATP synthase F0 subunit A [Bdellovibrionales bacterium GWB1_55_8]